MIVLRIRDPKSNGLSSGRYWYVASAAPNGEFTISMNVNNALAFASEADADAFNQRQMQLDHIVSPFEIKNL